MAAHISITAHRKANRINDEDELPVNRPRWNLRHRERGVNEVGLTENDNENKLLKDGRYFNRNKWLEESPNNKSSDDPVLDENDILIESIEGDIVEASPSTYAN